LHKAEARGVSVRDIDRVAAYLAARQKAAQRTALDLGTNAQRLDEAIKALRTKAASASPTPQEVREAEAIAIVARLQAAFEWLAQQAAARGASRVDYARARDTLAAMARASQDPATDAIAERLQTALDQLEQRAMGGGQVTREEFLALRDQMISQAREAASNR
jgi:hypothetical protein